MPNAKRATTPRLDPAASADVVLGELQAFSAHRRRDLVLWTSTARDADLAEAAVAAGTGHPARRAPRACRRRGRGGPVRRSTQAGVPRLAATADHGRGDRSPGRAGRAGTALRGAWRSAQRRGLRRPGRQPARRRRDGGDLRAGGRRVLGRHSRGRPPSRLRRVGDAGGRRAGFEAGAEMVVLQATEQGMPLCRRLGFTAFTKHRRYVTQFYG
jgi:hypothetical protein